MKPKPIKLLLSIILLVSCSISIIILFSQQVFSFAQPKVYILIIDGLGADKVSPQLTPFLWELIQGDTYNAVYYPEARAVMPSLTNPNHVSIMTGVYPQAHGITSNYYWNRHSPRPSQRLNYSHQIKVETLFTVAEKNHPQLVTAGILGKGKLTELFTATATGQKSPDYLWGYRPVFVFGLLFSSWDRKTMDHLIKIISQKDPDLVLVNLPDVDRFSHFFGPDSDTAQRTILTADAQIKRLVEFLKEQRKWKKAVLIITADHGFISVEPDPTNNRPYTVINFGKEMVQKGFKEVVPVSNGGIELLYLKGFDIASNQLNSEQAKLLKDIRVFALEQPGIKEAWYRLPNPEDNGDKYTLAKVHPDWYLNHYRSGELFLVAQPGYQFSDPFSRRRAALKGSHGGPNECQIPIIITGGYEEIRDQIMPANYKASTPDLGTTIAWLLHLPLPQKLNNSPIPQYLRGRVLLEAFQRNP
jgi:predicted AlkP superfamily pyrophosphatase or phosphodiesterase